LSRITSSAEIDLVVYGATGFTGRLVAQRLAQRLGPRSGISWGIAGRSEQKLAAVREEIGRQSDVSLIMASADDPASLEALAARTKMVITTVGPYQLYGAPLVAACARSGTDYLDLAGETAWMRSMIDAHDAQAKASGARILFSCGFDSIPFESGVLYLQDAAREQFGHPVSRVKARVRRLDGGFSSGTHASARATATSARDPGVLALLQDPFCLTPGFAGPKQPLSEGALYDPDLESWTAPFIMAPINTRNVHRSNFLQAHAYGADLVYDEMLVTGPGDQGEAIARSIAADAHPMRGKGGPRLGKELCPEARQAGGFDILFIGVDRDGRQIRAAVTGDSDPGYVSTSKMITETAICLKEAEDVPGGMWTPAAALGSRLLDRLSALAGLTFQIEAA
jgi:short subunit dehydrogenase-like uncharacterized protein